MNKKTVLIIVLVSVVIVSASVLFKRQSSRSDWKNTLDNVLNTIPTSADTSDWKNYVDNDFGFSFKYSDKYILESNKYKRSELESSVMLIHYGNVYRDGNIIMMGPLGFSVAIIPQPMKFERGPVEKNIYTNIQDAVKRYKNESDESLAKKYKKGKIGDVDTLSKISGPSSVVYALHNNDLYEITVFPENDIIAKTVYSTFKFNNQK